MSEIVKMRERIRKLEDANLQLQNRLQRIEGALQATLHNFGQLVNAYDQLRYETYIKWRMFSDHCPGFHWEAVQGLSQEQIQAYYREFNACMGFEEFCKQLGLRGENVVHADFRRKKAG